MRSLPPRALIGRAFEAAGRRLAAPRARRRDLSHTTFSTDAPPGELHVVCDAVPEARLQVHEASIEHTAALFLDHRFDLLGSGWVQVVHGCDCDGVEGIRHPPGPRVGPDRDGDWLAGRINRSNLEQSRRLWRLVDPGYVPIDWQLDFKSGYRWREDTWSADIVFGRLDGVDVKVPWELSRMQHLLVIAWAGRRATPDPSPFSRAFRNQVLDFISTNPPRFGVNWRCTMDVAIRAANWVLAYGLFRANGAEFDHRFEAAFKRSLMDHGRHIVGDLEFYPEGRANHYFADVTGLLFIAAGLPACPETDAWLAFAVQELIGETAFQFNPDGTNFEGSTAYHRLLLEMATYATALVLGLPEERRRVLRRDNRDDFRSRPRRPLAERIGEPDAAHAARLDRAAAFIMHATKHDGHVPQIGDNDNGRFLIPHPTYFDPGTADGDVPREHHLDHRGCVAAVAALTGRDDLARFAGTDRLERDLVTALTRGRRLIGGADAQAAARLRVGAETPLHHFREPAQTARVIEVIVPGGNLKRRLTLYGYPDFGLWVFRSERLFLAVRCGPVSGKGAGGSHAHNDQLAIELAIDSVDWVRDPGSYLYCPPYNRRNAWRSVRAHAAPQWPDREPGRLDGGNFRLVDDARARCLYFGEDGFAGVHWGFGTPVRRIIELGSNTVTIRDFGLPQDGTKGPARCEGREAVQQFFMASVPFSPGYGALEPSPPAEADGGSGTA